MNIAIQPFKYYLSALQDPTLSKLILMDSTCRIVKKGVNSFPFPWRSLDRWNAMRDWEHQTRIKLVDES